jgi:hypothetical protein
MDMQTNAEAIMRHFYSSMGYPETPAWHQLGDDFKAGFTALAYREEELLRKPPPQEEGSRRP